MHKLQTMVCIDNRLPYAQQMPFLSPAKTVRYELRVHDSINPTTRPGTAVDWSEIAIPAMGSALEMKWHPTP